MDKIQLLPDSVANQIAAGEVIQRPASVIKELVENSVDAGATTINVLVVDAGRTSIQVIDDGCGMSVTDARLSFERHATSKIRKAEDLFSLQTMGFRGEALPSIAAVTQVTLTTRREEDTVGTQLSISGSRVQSQEPVSCPRGSNFLIENLFFNVPVRRRFLKSNTTELNNIVTAFQRIALVYPEINFTLHSNHQELYNLRAASTHQRIADIFGKKLNQCLLPLEVETTLCTIKGYVGTPESAHKKGLQQYFFVNGRYMKHPYFQKAVINAYDRLINQGDQVPFFIYFTMKPEDIDVNIHPTKTEIKFQDEQAVWQILSAAVREAVGRYSAIPSIDFDTNGRPEMPVADGSEHTFTPSVDFNPQYNPFKGMPTPKSGMRTANAPVTSGSRLGASNAGNWEKLYEGLEKQLGGNGESAVDVPSSLSFLDMDSLPSSSSAMPADAEGKQDWTWEGGLQYRGSYIVATISDGLLVIDQERAHERILFEQYMDNMSKRQPQRQRVLFQELVQFNIAEMVVLPTILPEIEALGFELTDMGGGSYAINSIPADMEGINAPHLINEMVATAAEQTTSVKEELHRAMAMSMARNSAIPHGQVLSEDEMKNIVTKLFQCSNYRYTPSGKPVYYHLRHSDILRNLG